MKGTKKGLSYNITRISREILILALFFIFLAIGIWQKHAEIGQKIWNRTKLAGPAILLNRDAPLALSIGNYYFNVGGTGVYDLPRAEKYFLLAIARDPNIPDAWHQLARIDFLRGKYGGAMERINTQIEIHGDSLMASFYVRGLIEGYALDFKHAEIDFLKFLSWDAKNWATHNDLAWIYFRSGEYKKAEQIARRGLEYNPKNSWLLNSLGVALLNQEKKKEAREILLRAKDAAALLTPTSWGHAYPGNNPEIYRTGLEQMKNAIEKNIALSDT